MTEDRGHIVTMSVVNTSQFINLAYINLLIYAANVI